MIDVAREFPRERYNGYFEMIRANVVVDPETGEAGSENEFVVRVYRTKPHQMIAEFTGPPSACEDIVRTEMKRLARIQEGEVQTLTPADVQTVEKSFFKKLFG